MKTLKQIYSDEESSVGLTIQTGGPLKRIKSPNTGETRLVPCYENDFNWQNDKRQTMLDVDKLTDSTWNMSRNNLISKQVDRTHPASPTFASFEKNIKEV